MNDENIIVDTVKDVMSDLRQKADQYNLDQNILIEDKAVLLAEIKSSLIVLKGVNKSAGTVSKRGRIINCLFNQQLIYLAMKSISQNEELETQYNDLQDICHYSIPELKY